MHIYIYINIYIYIYIYIYILVCVFKLQKIKKVKKSKLLSKDTNKSILITYLESSFNWNYVVYSIKFFIFVSAFANKFRAFI